MTNKTLKQIVTVASCVIGLGTLSFLGLPKGYETIPNQVYQGWTPDEGRALLAFDPEKKQDREGRAPELPIYGDVARLGLDANELVGESYDLLVKIPRIGPKEVVKVTPSNE